MNFKKRGALQAEGGFMGELVQSGANVVGYIKNEKKYGMTCAWCMHVGYEELLLLIGEQSDTGKHLLVGDRIGISALSDAQENIALHFGERHSDQTDKFEGISFISDGTALLIPEARTQMTCQVLDIGHVKGNEEDLLVHVKILSSHADETKCFLVREHMKE